MPDDRPAILFIDDLARELQCSRTTIETRRRNGTLPIPELPAIDKRPRWSRYALDRYHEGHEDRPIRRRRA